MGDAKQTHSLRRTNASVLFKGNGDVCLGQSLFGHA